MPKLIHCKECGAEVAENMSMTWTEPEDPDRSIELCSICYDARDAKLRAEFKAREQERGE